MTSVREITSTLAWVDADDPGEVWETALEMAAAELEYFKCPDMVTPVVDLEVPPPGASLTSLVAGTIEYRLRQERWPRRDDHLQIARLAQDMFQSIVIAEGIDHHQSVEDMIVDKFQQVLAYREVPKQHARMHRELEVNKVNSITVPIDASGYVPPDLAGGVVYLQKMLHHPRTRFIICATPQTKELLLQRGGRPRPPGYGRIGGRPPRDAWGE